MLYFVPAWYSENGFKENSQQWYQRRLVSEVDDTVKQLQLFDRKKVCDTCTLLLNHAPNYRHFLHRQGLLHNNYFSIFDSIQNVKVKKAAIFSYRDLKWPSDIEFVYSPFCIIAYLDGKKYAQIEFGEDGNMIQIDMYQDGLIKRRNIYDDRGFLSLTIVYQNGKWAYEQYLNTSGIWVICKYNDGHVLVNEKENKYLINDEYYPFLKSEYSSIDELIKEVFVSYLKHTNKDDIFIIAMHKLHSLILSETLNNHKTILSFFNERLKLNDEYSIALCEKADAIVLDSRDTYYKVGLDRFNFDNKVTDITPFDCRVDFGISRQLKQKNILLSVDLLSDEKYEKVIIILLNYMLKNSDIRTILFTRNGAYNIEDILLNKTREILDKNGFDSDYANKKSNVKFENNLNDSLPTLFYVRQCVDELSLSKCLREQRLVIDLGKQTDLFLQIGSISMGIPMIIGKSSEYVEDGKNGVVLNDLDSLDKVLSYYLDTLNNWNNAMIASYEIGKKFSSDNLVKWWKGVINYVL